MGILGIYASSVLKVTNSYESIATVTVGSGGAADVTFSSIPSTFTHLQVRAIARGTSTPVSLVMQFNGATTNYNMHQLYGDGSSVTSANPSDSAILIGNLTPSSAGANIFAGNVIDILDYKNTNKNTTARALSGYDNNGSGFAVFQSGLWVDTSAITSIKLFPRSATGNLVQYSSFALYGIKG
jgi:hypothetical protein